MADIGKRNVLRAVRAATQGLYLDGGALGEILLPRRYATMMVGATVDVFVYRDSEDRLVATTETPLAVVGEFAFLKVVSSNPKMGAFLDWGLAKDLLLPIREQSQPVMQGEWVVVHVDLDPHTGRIVASARLQRFLDITEAKYNEGEKVRLLIAGTTPLGYKAIVENKHWGLLYHAECSVMLTTGQRLDGYVRTVRPDGKIDLGLDPAGYRRVASLTQVILDALDAAGGRIEFDDKSDPEAIRATFHTSKKAFKQALGALYRERRIRFAGGGTELVKA